MAEIREEGDVVVEPREDEEEFVVPGTAVDDEEEIVLPGSSSEVNVTIHTEGEYPTVPGQHVLVESVAKDAIVTAATTLNHDEKAATGSHKASGTSSQPGAFHQGSDGGPVQLRGLGKNSRMASTRSLLQQQQQQPPIVSPEEAVPDRMEAQQPVDSDEELAEKEQVDGDLVVEQVCSDAKVGEGDEKAKEKDRLKAIQSLSEDGAPGTATMVTTCQVRPGSQKGFGLSRLSAKQLNVSGHSSTSSFNNSRRSLLRGIRKNSEMHLQAGPNNEEDVEPEEDLEEEDLEMQRLPEDRDVQEEEEEIPVMSEGQEEEEHVLPPMPMAAPPGQLAMPPIMGMPQELPERSTTRASTRSEPGAQRVAGFNARPWASEHTITLGVSFRRPSHMSGLIEATAVSREFSSTFMMEAQQVDVNTLEARQIKEQKERQCRRVGYVLVAVSLLVLGLALGFGLSNNDQQREPISSNTDLGGAGGGNNSTSSTAWPLPPMENLEILYNDLPEKSKESISDSTSPQYQAWEWLMNHPNITGFEEWRKKQLFAMGSFFYSFEGPNWPGKARSKWMNTTTSECTWTLSDGEIAYWTGLSQQYVGNISFQAHQTCNERGELQTLIIPQIWFPEQSENGTVLDIRPVMPPEIGLLSSLGFLSMVYGDLKMKLADYLIPELVGLPLLRMLNLQSSGLNGIIPKQIDQMTGLEYAILGRNLLTGTLPPEFAQMTSLEFLSLNAMPGIAGTIPSELGLMTNLKRLAMPVLSLTGTIPSQMGMMTSMTMLTMDLNHLTGSVPSQLGLLTSNGVLRISRNQFTGTVPSELGLLTQLGELSLFNGGLRGELPSQLGLLTKLTDLLLGNGKEQPEDHHRMNFDGQEERLGDLNNFTGSFPSELWQLSHLKFLHLQDLPYLYADIPFEPFSLMSNLTEIKLSGSPNITGTIPAQFCGNTTLLSFNCSVSLCGCSCECI